MTDGSDTPPQISPSLERVLAATPSVDASSEQRSQWVLALLKRYIGIVARVGTPNQVETIRQLRLGDARLAACVSVLDADVLSRDATARARAEGARRVVERHLIEVVLAHFVFETPDLADERSEPVPAPSSTMRRDSAGIASEDAEHRRWQPRSSAPTPLLDRFGLDLTQAAADGRLTPMIGRVAELDRIEHTLCRRIKRNPLLVGAAGTGKTAIVEGLAQRIVSGDVSEPLRGMRVIALQPSSVVASAGYSSEFPKRVHAIIAEASQDGIVLFIDELHTAIGAGGRVGAGDLAQLLKPALARGEIACIGATTDDEYRRFVAPDAALARRFEPIRVEELSRPHVVQLLQQLRNESRVARGIVLCDEVLQEIVEIGARFLPNRCFPDKAIDLLDHVVADARARGVATASVHDVGDLLRSLLAVPRHTETTLQRLSQRLTEHRLLAADDASALVDRLTVTLNGLDLSPARPNAVLLLTGTAAARVDEVASIIAETIFGAESRVVSIDFAGMTESASVSRLVGAPPGLVGYDDRHALDAVAESPWCVVIARNVDAAHDVVRTTFEPALARGVITDMRGRRIYFADTVVLVTAAEQAGLEAEKPVRGFNVRASGFDLAAEIDYSLFGDRTQVYFDVVVQQAPLSHAATPGDWVRESVLTPLTSRLTARGLRVDWDVSVIDWIGRGARAADAAEQLVERQILPAIAAKAFTDAAGGGAKRFLARMVNGELELAAVPLTEIEDPQQ